MYFKQLVSNYLKHQILNYSIPNFFNFGNWFSGARQYVGNLGPDAGKRCPALGEGVEDLVCVSFGKF
jgi:hypothetical protein